MTASEINTLEDVERFAAANGIMLTATDKARITSAQEAELKRLETLQAEDAPPSWADNWNELYPRVLTAIISAGETLLTFSHTILTALGVPIVLVLLLVVEHHRVVEGIRLFDPSPEFSGFAAWALVLLNLVLEFQVHHIEHLNGYTEATAYRWSLRIAAQNAAYTLGMSKTWTPQALSPASRYKSMLRLVTFTILALALTGSMRIVIEATGGTWHEALGVILRESSLILMMTWTGGLLFALAAVLSAQGLSRYVAIRTVEIVVAMRAREANTTNPHAKKIDQVGALAALAIINEKRAKIAAKTAPPVEVKPVQPVPVPFSMNGNHNGNGKHATVDG